MKINLDKAIACQILANGSFRNINMHWPYGEWHKWDVKRACAYYEKARRAMGITEADENEVQFQ